MIIKSDDKTSNKFGKKPNDRTFEELLEKGVIIVDKHSGPTSHQVIDSMKKILDIPKAGHSGTLDPKVTGVLVTGLGKGTKLMEYMLKAGKEYITLMYLHKPVEEEKLKKVINNFVGKIIQTPPIMSAVKRQPREREIYLIDILDIDGQNVLFRTSVQHGTYIRKLCSDIGDELGCKAHMAELRRTKASIFTEDESISLTKLDDLMTLYKEYKKDNNSESKKKIQKLEEELRKYIRPMEDALKEMKKVFVKDSTVSSLCQGNDLGIPGISKLDDNIEIGETIAIMTLKGELVAIGIAMMNSKDIINKNKGFFVKTNKTFMEFETYPTPWKKEREQGRTRRKNKKNKK